LLFPEPVLPSRGCFSAARVRHFFTNAGTFWRLGERVHYRDVLLRCCRRVAIAFRANRWRRAALDSLLVTWTATFCRRGAGKKRSALSPVTLLRERTLNYLLLLRLAVDGDAATATLLRHRGCATCAAAFLKRRVGLYTALRAGVLPVAATTRCPVPCPLPLPQRGLVDVTAAGCAVIVPGRTTPCAARSATRSLPSPLCFRCCSGLCLCVLLLQPQVSRHSMGTLVSCCRVSLCGGLSWRRYDHAAQRMMDWDGRGTVPHAWRKAPVLPCACCACHLSLSATYGCAVHGRQHANLRTKPGISRILSAAVCALLPSTPRSSLVTPLAQRRAFAATVRLCGGACRQPPACAAWRFANILGITLLSGYSRGAARAATCLPFSFMPHAAALPLCHHPICYCHYL